MGGGGGTQPSLWVQGRRVEIPIQSGSFDPRVSEKLCGPQTDRRGVRVHILRVDPWTRTAEEGRDFGIWRPEKVGIVKDLKHLPSVSQGFANFVRTEVTSIGDPACGKLVCLLSCC